MLLLIGWTHIFRLYDWWKLKQFRSEIFVRDLGKKMSNYVEARGFLVLGIYYEPRGLFVVG